MDNDILKDLYLSEREVLKSPTFRGYDSPNHNNAASVFAKVRSIRTEDDIREAINILKEVPFYASMQKDDDEMDRLLTETLDAIKVRTYKQGEIVFHQEDHISEFYIIIEGTVDVYAQKTEEEMNDEVLQMANEPKVKSNDLIDLTKSPRMPRKSQFISPNVIQNLLSEEKPPQFQLKKGSNSMRNLRRTSICIIAPKYNTMTPLLGFQDCYQMHQGQMLFRLKNRRTLGPGTHFGELALANNCAGNVTVVAASELKVAALSKNDFGRICNESDRSFQEKINFFAKLMGRASRNSVARFCYGFKERQYSYGQKIFIQGQVPSEVYLVKNGEVQITNQENPEKTNSKSKKLLTGDKIANLGPYNFLGTGDVFEGRPYKVTATSCSHNLILYVIPIKDFRNLKTSYQDVFDRFLEKFNAQLHYFEDRVENVCSINKKVLCLPAISVNNDIKSPKASLTPLNLNHIHSTKFIEQKIIKGSEFRSGLTTRRTSMLAVRNDDSSPQSGDPNMIGSLSHRNQFKTATPKAKDLTSRQVIPKEKNNFEDYCDVLIPLQDIMGPKHNVKTRRASRAAQDLNDREFKIGTTLKILAEHAKNRNRRSSCDDTPQTTFLMEQNPRTIFRNIK